MAGENLLTETSDTTLHNCENRVAVIPQPLQLFTIVKIELRKWSNYTSGGMQTIHSAGPTKGDALMHQNSN